VGEVVPDIERAREKEERERERERERETRDEIRIQSTTKWRKARLRKERRGDPSTRVSHPARQRERIKGEKKREKRKEWERREDCVADGGM